jgi:hypothetical protein
MEIGSFKKIEMTQLSQPDSFFWPGYFWFWNDHLSEEKIFSQLRYMNAVGAKSVWIIPIPKDFRPDSMPTDMQPDYLSEDYLILFANVVDEMRRLDMRLWLYDEGGWPSGSACGRIVGNNPALAQQCLRKQSLKPNRGQMIRIPQHCLAAYVSDGNIPAKRLTPGQDVKIAAEGVEIDLYDVEYMNAPTPGRPLFPDLLNPRSTHEFIRLTHEEYKRTIGEHFGQTVPLILSDDVKAVPLPWTDDFRETFANEKGYDLVEKLPSLFGGNTHEDKQVRVDYYDWWTNRFAQAFFGQIQNWCARNHLWFSGHVGGEEDIAGVRVYSHGHVLRNFRYFDIPGVDAVWRHIFPAEKTDTPGRADQDAVDQFRIKNNHFPKYASSVSHQEGKPFTFIEQFSVYGSGLSLDQMKWITDFSYVRGINLTTMGETYLSTKDFYMGAMRPMFFPGNPLWRYLPLYHAYTARLSYLMSLGTPDLDAAIYYPIRDVWAATIDELKPLSESLERLAEILFSSRCDFDFIDDDVLERQATKIEEGKLVVGPMRYRRIFVSASEWMTERAREKLKVFVEGGGNVFLMDHTEKNDRLEAGVSLAWSEVGKVLAPLVQVEPKDSRIRACKRRLENGTLYLLTNEDTKRVQATLRFTEPLPLIRLDPETGECWKPAEAFQNQGMWSLPLALEFGESCVVLFTRDALPFIREPMKPGGEVLTLDLSWMCRKLKAYVIGEHDIEIHDEGAEPFHEIELGDWRPTLGEDFSGDVEYEIQFQCTRQEAEDSFFLDLGTVKYACEAFLNGVSLGQRAWPPFSFPIREIIREGSNRLNITVTNTLANQYVTTRRLDQWSEKIIGPYHKIALRFEWESLPSGLFGPVTIRKNAEKGNPE